MRSPRHAEPRVILIFILTQNPAAPVASVLVPSNFNPARSFVLSFLHRFLTVGGRDSAGVFFESDVWASENGTEWQLLANDQFGDRAYHSMLEMDGCLYIMAGQTFSTFYNDVWKSCDEGSTWTAATEDAAWPERAGQAAIVTSDGEMIVAGGCYNDESGTRSFRSDVWASTDGVNWELRTAEAEWAARSGPRLVEFKGKLYIVAGEIGFTPSTQLVDIWSSDDGGRTWSLVVETPEFTARSGHGVVVTPDGSTMLVVAGWPQLHDLWSSTDGITFKQESNEVWGCDGIISSVSQIGCGKVSDCSSPYH